jgi:hypothetical protein
MAISFPALAPGVHVFHRDDSKAQIGIDPATAIVTDEVVIRALLPYLTGAYSTSEVLTYAATHDLDEDSVLSFLELLHSLTLLIDNSPSFPIKLKKTVSEHQYQNLLRETKQELKCVERRSLTEIEIRGAGRLGTTICLFLASAGFSNIRIIDSRPTSSDDLTPWGASRIDLGARRDQVAAQIVERISKGFSNHNNYLRFRPEAKLVVLVPDQNADFPWLDPLTADSVMAEGTPHMFTALATNESHISEVIVPGKSPCIRCSYYTLCDIDPAWPAIYQQLSNRTGQDLAATEQVIRTALATVEIISNWIDSGISELGIVHKLKRDFVGQITEQTEFHPSCGCAWDRGISD